MIEAGIKKKFIVLITKKIDLEKNNIKIAVVSETIFICKTLFEGLCNYDK